MTSEEFAQRLDYVVLDPGVSARDVQTAASQAIEKGVGGVCVAPIWSALLAGALGGSRVRAAVVVSFPLGGSKSVIKAIEASNAMKDGIDEVEVVAHLPHLIAQDYTAARGELLEIVRAVRAVRRDAAIAVVIESAFLMTRGAERGEAAIALACRAIRESGCDTVTSDTGHHPAGAATPAAIRLIRTHAAGLMVKASGGIRTAEQARDLLAAGADRVGIHQIENINIIGY